MSSREIILADPGLVLNTSSEMHCLHACLMMALRTAHGINVPSFSELDVLMKTDPKLYTWQYSIIRLLVQNGFNIEMTEMFDVDQFLNDNDGYCLSYFGEEVGRDQIENSDLNLVSSDIRSVSDKKEAKFVVKEPDISDIKNYIEDGWYCLLNLNQRTLQSDDGYRGHMIFAYGFSERGIRIHNPGPPATRSSEIAWPLFDKAWSFPTKSVRNILAVRHKGQSYPDKGYV